MIKVRLFTDEERSDLVRGRKEPEYAVCDAGVYFKHNPRTITPKESLHVEFRSAESLQFLREACGIDYFASDDSVVCLHESVQSGLTAIDMSRDGKYVWCWPAEKEIWQALAHMPFDILIAVCRSDIHVFWRDITGVDCLIENYPYDNQIIEVLVKDDFIRLDNSYKAVPATKRGRFDTSYGLCIGGDGKYYSDWIGFEYALQYYWKNDIEGIIQEIDRLNEHRIALADTTYVYDTFELGGLLAVLGRDSNCIEELDYLYKLDMLNEFLEEGSMTKDEYDKELQKLQAGDSYKYYLYYRDTFRYISHLSSVPMMLHSRKPPALIVDKNADGTYFIHGRLTVKWPVFCELISNELCGCSKGVERFVLVVDVNEMMCSAQDLKYAVCGLRRTDDRLDIYDAYTGTKLFGEALKEAYYSGKCTVDEEFY